MIIGHSRHAKNTLAQATNQLGNQKFEESSDYLQQLKSLYNDTDFENETLYAVAWY